MKAIKKNNYVGILLTLLAISFAVSSCSCNRQKSRKDYIDIANQIIDEDSMVEETKTFYYTDYFGYEYYIKLSGGTATGAPANDPEEIETLGDITRHQQYLNPLKGYYNKDSSGCQYEVIFGSQTYYIGYDNYIYTSYTDARSKNHDNGFKITHVD